MNSELNKISSLIEEIDLEKIYQGKINNPIVPLATDAYGNYVKYNVYANYNDYSRYSRHSNYNNYDVYSRYHVYYYDYNDYSDYYDYNDYSDYYDYYNYSNYINTGSIITSPSNITINAGTRASFSVSISGTPTSYQWYEATSATGAGTRITGATTATYSFIASIDKNGKYYYCRITFPGNTVTSGRAKLSVRDLQVYDMYLSTDMSLSEPASNFPANTQIVYSILSGDSVEISQAGLVTPKSLGTTQIRATLNGSPTLSKDFSVYVIENKLEAIFYNTAIAIRGIKKISNKLYPNEMAETLRNGEVAKKSYSTLNELFLDIANAIRTIKGISQTMQPEDFYNIILE